MEQVSPTYAMLFKTRMGETYPTCRRFKTGAEARATVRPADVCAGVKAVMWIDLGTFPATHVTERYTLALGATAVPRAVLLWDAEGQQAIHVGTQRSGAVLRVGELAPWCDRVASPVTVVPPLTDYQEVVLIFGAHECNVRERVYAAVDDEALRLIVGYVLCGDAAASVEEHLLRAAEQILRSVKGTDAEAQRRLKTWKSSMDAWVTRMRGMKLSLEDLTPCVFARRVIQDWT